MCGRLARSAAGRFLNLFTAQFSGFGSAPREPSHVHAARKVLAFNVARGDEAGIGLPDKRGCRRSNTLSGAIAGLRLGILTIEFNQHRVIPVRSKRTLDRLTSMLDQARLL